MDRYLLDTNILVFAVSGQTQNLSIESRNILSDFSNQLHASSISVLELLQLYRIGKIKVKSFKSADELIDAIENLLYIKILPFTTYHIETVSKLKIPKNHNDPIDHAIIAHAITEKLTLVSSDRKFQKYTTQGLDFAFNKR